MRPFHYLLALLMVLFFVSITFAGDCSSAYFKSYSCGDLNINLSTSQYSYFRVDNNSWTPTGELDWNSDVSAVNGKSYALNTTTNKYASISDNASWTLGSNEWSISFWAYAIDVSNSYPGVFTNGGTGYDYSIIGYFKHGGVSSLPTFWITRNDSNAVNIYGDSALSAGQWYWFVLQREGDTVKLYINNVLQTRTIDVPGWTLKDPTGGVMVGNDGDPASNRLNGYVDELLIFKGKYLDTTARSTLYNSGRGNYGKINTSPWDTNLVAGWHFDEGTGTNIADFSGNNNALTTSGSPLFATGKVLLKNWTDQNLIAYYKFNESSGTTVFDSAKTNNGTLTNGATIQAKGMWDSNALNLDGSDDYLSIPAASDLNTTIFTMSTWIFPTASTGSIFDKRDATTDSIIGLLNAGLLHFRINATTQDGTTPVSLNQWHHIVYQYDGTYMKTWIDGRIDINANVGSLTLDTSAPLTIGQTASSLYFKGQIDEFKFYNRFLSPTEILADYNSFLNSPKFVADSNATITGAELRDWNRIRVNEGLYYSFGKQLEDRNSNTRKTNQLDVNSTVYSQFVDANLIGLWHLNNLTDASGNGRDLNSAGAVPSAGLWDTNGYNASVSGGVKYYLQANTPSTAYSFNVGGQDKPFTAAIWVKNNSTAIANMYMNPILSSYWRMYVEVGFGMCLYGSGYSTYICRGFSGLDSTTLPYGQWRFLVVTYDGSEVPAGIKAYLDGVRVDTETTDSGGYTGMPSGSPEFKLGTGNVSVASNIIMDEAMLWDKNLSAAEIKLLYESQAGNFNEPNLAGLWHLNLNANDASGNSRTGTWNGTPHYGNGLWDTNSGYFDGSTNYVDMGDVLDVGSTDYSISAWFKTDGNNNNTQVIVGKNALGSRSIFFGTNHPSGNNAHGGSFFIQDAAGNISLIASTTSAVDDNQWHHMVGVFNYGAHRISIYLDGTLQDSSTTVTGTPNYDTTGSLRIGNQESTRYFKGNIEDVGIWAAGLNSQQVADLYRKGSSRLDVNVYSCSSAACTTKTSSQYITDINNNTLTPVDSLLVSTYLGYEFLFRPIAALADYNAGVHWVNSFAQNFYVESGLGNIPPTVTFNTLDGQTLATNPHSFSYIQDGNLTIDLNVFDSDNDQLRLSVWYDAGQTQDTGTLLYSDINIAPYCLSTTWNVSSVKCTIDINTISQGVTDGNYYLKLRLKDTSDATSSVVSTRRFAVDNTAPTITVANTHSDWNRLTANVALACSDALVGCSVTKYRLNGGAWTTYTSALSFTGDGNYVIDYNAVDTKGNVSVTQTVAALVGYNGNLHTYTDQNVPESYFGTGGRVRFVFDGNIGIAPTILVKDSSNAPVYSGAMHNISGDATFGLTDLNTYYADVDINGAVGWVDVTVQNQRFGKALYHSSAWASRFSNPSSQIFPFSFDLNITEPNINKRWFSPIDQNIAFSPFRAASQSVRVLDYNGTHYLEVPSELKNISTSGGLVTSAELIFLATLDKNETHTYYVSFSTAQYPTLYATDANLIASGFRYDYNSSLYSLRLDINKGGAIINSRSRIGTNLDLNYTTTQEFSPEASIQGTSYDVTSVSAPTYSVSDGNLKRTVLVSGSRTYTSFTIYDYNTLYTFYSKSPYVLIDTNYIVQTPSSNYTLYDYSSQLVSSLLSRVAYSDGTLYDYNTSETLASINDANYFGVYTSQSLDAIGRVFLDSNSNKSAVSTPEKTNLFGALTIKRKLLSSATLATGDYANTTGALVFFNPLQQSKDLNAVFYNLKNPLTVSVGSTTTNDAGTPPVLLDINYTPYTTLYDQNDVNCFATYSDDTMIGSILISITGPNIDVNTTATINDQTGTASYVIDSNILNGGTITCTFTATDAADHSDTNAESFTVIDTRAPVIYGLANTPDTNAGIDPDTVVVVDANITEYAALSTVTLWYRHADTNVWSDWNSLTMNFDTNYSDVNYAYDGNFMASQGSWQYFVQAIDVNGLDTNSSTRTIYAFTDYTWTMTPISASFGNKSGALGTVITVGTIDINNTGDTTLNFKLKSDWDTKYSTGGAFAIRYNSNDETSSGYTFSLASGDSGSYIVTLQTKSTQRQDALTVTVDATDALATPDSNAVTGNIVSFEDGAFLLMEWLDENASVTQGTTGVTYGIKVTNLGNADANSIRIFWDYPADWTLTSGVSDINDLNLAVDEYLLNSLGFTVPSNALVGTKTLTTTASCCSDTNKTNQLTTTTVVTAHSSGGGSDTGGGSSGSGGTGGSGGSGSSPFILPAQKDLFFQTNEFYELVRGQDSSFPIKVTNPLNGPLTNVHLSVTGIVSSYLKLEKDTIDSLDANQEFTTNIAITSPKYFTPGEYALTFTITGTFTDSYHRPTQFKEERQINLLIHDTNEATAKQYLLDMNGFIVDLSARNFKLSTLPELFSASQALFKSHDFDGVKKNYDEAKNIYELALEANAKSKDISGLVGLSSSNGISTPNTDRLLALAQLAFQRGDYALALSRLKEAELTYSLETKGEFNLGVWILANLDKVAVMIVLLAIAAYLLYTGVKLILIKKKLKDLTAEDNLLLGLIQDLQKRTFTENKVGMGEYYDALTQFEKRISSVSEDIINYTAKRNNALKFASPVTRLAQEKKSLLGNIKATQELYFNKGLVETRIYRTKVNSLTKRLSEVEEQIVSNQLEKTIRIHATGPIKYFWRAYYKIFK